MSQDCSIEIAISSDEEQDPRTSPPRISSGETAQTSMTLPGTSIATASSGLSVPFSNQLESILDSSGGLDSSTRLEDFFALCSKANTWNRRSALLKVLQASSRPILSSFVAENGMIRVLENWFDGAISENKPLFVANMLTTLSLLPVTHTSLKKPCRIGRMVGDVRKNKNLDEKTKNEAKILRQKWVKAFEAPSMVKAPAETQKKPISAPKRKNETGLDDVDLFAGNQKKINKPKNGAGTTQRVRVVASNAAKSTKTTTSVAKVSASPLDGLTSISSPQFKRPNGQQSRPRTVLAPAANAPTVTGPMTAAQRAKLAADSVPDMPPRQKRDATGRRTKITWADGWNGPNKSAEFPDKLVSERLFLKDQPPSKASEDAVYDESTSTAAAAAPVQEAQEQAHQNFEMAAKQQHHSEAQALKDFKAQEDLERKEVEDRLRTMKTTVPWRDAPVIPKSVFDAMSSESTQDMTPARGENSHEKHERQQRRHQVPPASYALDSPEEPPVGASVPIQPVHLIPRIPLSTEEAANQSQRREPALAQVTAPQRLPMGASRGFNVQTAPPRPLQKFGGPMLGLHGAINKRPEEQAGPQNQQWGPKASSFNSNGQPPVCHYFNTPRGCSRGEACKFAHVRSDSVVPMSRRPTADLHPRKMQRQ
jgi:hypothetical protein